MWRRGRRLLVLLAGVTMLLFVIIGLVTREVLNECLILICLMKLPHRFDYVGSDLNILCKKSKELTAENSRKSFFRYTKIGTYR